MADPCRHLPSDLQYEILCRLPVKTLLRFRCVSKSWLFLVDKDANFARLHLKTFKNNSDNTRLLVVQTRTDDVKKIEFEVRCSDTFELIHQLSKSPNCGATWSYSVDGLILLKYVNQRNGPFRSGPFRDLKVWNPSIRKLLEIPLLKHPNLPYYPTSVVSRDIGIGYDPLTNDYKIVNLVSVTSPWTTLDSVSIYSLAAGSWRIIQPDQGFDWHWDLPRIIDAVYFRGSLYLIGINNLVSLDLDLVWFDLNKEVFFSVNLREDLSLGDFHCFEYSLEVIEAGLSFSLHDLESWDIHVWVVDTDTMIWNKQYVYSLNKGYVHSLTSKPYLYSVRFLCESYIKKNGDILTWRNCFKSEGD